MDARVLPPRLQEAYHTWLRGIPAMRYHPRLALLVQISIDFLLIYYGCPIDQGHVGLILPPLMAAWVLLCSNTGLEALSLVSLAAYAVAAVCTTGMVLMQDKCLTSLLAMGQKDLLTLVLGTSLDHMVWCVQFPVMVKHAWMFEGITLFTTPLIKYSQYLSHQPDPEHWALLAIFVTSFLNCITSIAVRHYLAKLNFCSFLKTI